MDELAARRRRHDEDAAARLQHLGLHPPGDLVRLVEHGADTITFAVNTPEPVTFVARGGIQVTGTGMRVLDVHP